VSRAAREALLAVRDLRPRLEAAGEEMDRSRRLPPELVAALVEAGLFRLALPRAAGGAEVDLLSFLDVAEALAAADGSAGWCLVQASFSAAQVVAFLGPEAVQEVFGDEKTVLANGTGNGGTAVPVEGGYRLSGRWPFASGCTHATWYKAAARVVGAGGEDVRGEAGALPVRTFLFPAAAEYLEDTWHVSGLRGTGSHTIAVREVFVPSRRAPDLARDERREGGALYRVPSSLLAAAGFSAVAMGIARGALDVFGALARRKSPRGAGKTLGEDPVVQDKVARAEATLRSSEAFLRQAAGKVWDVLATGEELSAPERALLRLAATHGSNQAAGVVDVVYHASGATAIFESEGLARRFRDVHAVTQQIQSSDLHYQAVGRVLLGLEPQSDYV
jgi:alkylation response protein AidB-like acyl-CoA dehydrogenase